ncbi:hypothetical protein HQ585_08700 [candidate division KSB1 bacterium]|nr:hypothetical protein [candidate division KSB1 bacterium]
MFQGTKHYWLLAVIAVLLIGVLGCENLLEDALNVEVDMNEPLFNGTYNEPVTQVNVASNLTVSNSSAKVAKASGFGSANFTVDDTRKLLFALDFGSVTIEAEILNESATVETITFYFSTEPSLSDPVTGGASLIFSEDLAAGSNSIDESLTDGVNGLNQTDAVVVSNFKDFFSANQGQGTYTVYAVIADGADNVTVTSFILDIGAVFIQTESFTSDSLEKYASENAQLDGGYIDGSVMVNGSAVTTFKIYLGDTGGLYPPANHVVASKEGIAAGATYIMAEANKSDYMVNQSYLDETLTALSNGSVSSVEANLYISSEAAVNVTLISSVRGTLTLGN